MEFGQDELKDQYSDNKEEDQDQEEEEEDDHNQVRNTFTTNNNTSTRLDPLSFCAPSISSSSSSSSKKWPQIIINNSSTGNNSHLQLMDYLSLKTGGGGAAVESSNANSGLENRGGSGSGGGGGFSLMYSGGEREHMFDKVVTPSDVGKLNRLVIPKQHAEKYFPLDSASNEKGLLLNFEDRSGKSWRFRYSYWNSSQSYVMTKGWSRFVKEKKLDAGDIVSFERESPAGGGRLFIDWRRRPHHQYYPHHHHHHQQYHHLLSNPASLFPIDPFHQQRWGGGGGGGDGGGMLHSLPLSMSVPMQPPQPPPPPPRRSIENLQYIYNSSMIQYPSYNHHHHHHHHQQQHQFQYQHHHHQDYINSAPAAGPAVAAAAAAGPSKRLRLFGVNMEYCPMNEQEAQASSGGHERIASSSVQYPLQVRIPTHDNSSPILPLPLPLPLPRPTSFPAEFSHEYKGKSANNSLSFDLDP